MTSSVLEAIVDRGEYNPPLPMQALEYGQRLFQCVYLKLKNQKLQPERLEMLNRWEEAAILMQKGMAPLQQQMTPQQTTVQGGGAETVLAPQVA